MAKEKEDDKTLKGKAIEIKGKDYVMVKDRVAYFNDTYPNGGIETTILSNLNEDNIIIKAIVTPNWELPSRRFTGHAQETVGEGYINKTSALENAETSAVGRALAMLGIGVLESIASGDEINKAENAKGRTKTGDKTAVNLNNIKDDDVRQEVESIIESINASKDLEQLKEFKDMIRKSDLTNDAKSELIKVWNIKKKSLDKE